MGKSIIESLEEFKQYVGSFDESIHEIHGLDISLPYQSYPNETKKLLEELCIKISLNNSQTKNQNEKILKDDSLDVFFTYRFLDPFVGALAIYSQNGKFFISACHRGAFDGDNHAEFTLIERTCRDIRFSEGDILYTTLEPCTKESRNKWNRSCSEVIVGHKISKVVVGILDPNPLIAGDGVDYLLKNGVDVSFFSFQNQEEIRKNNNAFLKQFEVGNPKVYRDIFDVFHKYIDSDAMNKYIKKCSQDKKPSNIDKDLGNEFSCIFDFYKKMTLNRSILAATKEIDKYTCTDDFALFFFKEPKNIVDGATLRLIESKGETKPSLKDESLYSLIAFLENKLVDFYGSKLKNTQATASDSNLKKLELGLFKNVREKNSLFREVIVNALVHRDYKSPIFTEITLGDSFFSIKNPVSEKLTLEDVDTMNKHNYGSHPTNSRLMRYFMDIGYCERNANGMEIIAKYSKYVGYSLNGNILETKLSWDETGSNYGNK